MGIRAPSRGWKPLFAEVDASATEATIGERLEFDAKDVTDNERWINSLDWDLGDGTTATGWWTGHRYDEAGEYTVSLIATANDEMTTTHEVTIIVGDLAESIAHIKPSATDVSSGERVKFDVQDTSGDDCWIDSLEWDLGDDTLVTGWLTDHRYDEPGEYTITLTATDNTGPRRSTK